jgi:hypothetical protein
MSLSGVFVLSVVSPDSGRISGSASRVPVGSLVVVSPVSYLEDMLKAVLHALAGVRLSRCDGDLNKSLILER